VTQFGSTALTGAGAKDETGAEDWFFLSKSNALTKSFSSATSDEIAGVEELVPTLATTALARDLRTLDLLSIIFKHSRGKPAPSLEAPFTKRARQEVPQDVHAASLQVPASVPAIPSVAAAVSVPAAPSVTADVLVLVVSSDLAAVPTHADTEVHAEESTLDDNPTTSKQVSAEHSIAASTLLSSRKCGKQIAKKRVSPIVDIADDALIKFDSASSIHACYDMEGHTKHFTSLRKLLHMVEKNDLRKLLGAVNNFYQREEPDTFALLLWGDLHVHVLETVDGRVIYMFVDISYPLSATTLQRMLKHGLEVPKLLVGKDLTMAEQLVSFIKAALLNAQSASDP
nr:hypothetical protein [Tanacetum cinerariifolium]